ncbi:MBL fold metallo-hydrolase [Ciceribacter sp. L1K23]|uniref:MBL fold metallo-hydrolase n=1 Tax=Ciceribacter sp. L1K23 TaxID=2820276 RepID=UPI001B82C1B8|nr:MBL fold metallo-hydrolase [Ciceribacter sp. L1K23]MBR0558190.1 MBL fold metallo-hydrolase [Ciceribacter sp. L1K23]
MQLRFAVISTLALLATISPTAAQDRGMVSQCQLVAERLPSALYATYNPQVDGTFAPLKAAARDEVVITYVGHSTFEITAPDGVTIATDYSGSLRTARLPDVVTMNKAHSSHYTLFPDPAIEHVLHGWHETPGQKAEHRLVVGESYIRNVSTDIRGFGGFEENGNSIFIFEIAGLCIGHLGHLHHELTDSHYAEIGRLDVVMVPVDGGLTMGAQSMSGVISRLRSALVLPMHRRGPIVDSFMAMFDDRFDKSFSEHQSVTVSMRTLPKKPLILVLRGF